MSIDTLFSLYKFGLRLGGGDRFFPFVRLSLFDPVVEERGRLPWFQARKKCKSGSQNYHTQTTHTRCFYAACSTSEPPVYGLFILGSTYSLCVFFVWGWVLDFIKGLFMLFAVRQAVGEACLCLQTVRQFTFDCCLSPLFMLLRYVKLSGFTLVYAGGQYVSVFKQLLRDCFMPVYQYVSPPVWTVYACTHGTSVQVKN